MRSLALRPGDSLTAPKSGFVDELQVLSFPHTCHPSYGGLASTPAGFTLLLNTLAFIGHTRFLDNTSRGKRQDPHVLQWGTVRIIMKNCPVVELLQKPGVSMSFKCLVSRTPVIQATGVWLLPRQALLSC